MPEFSQDEKNKEASMPQFSVDVSIEGNSPLLTKEQYLLELKKLDLVVPASYAEYIPSLDQIAGAAHARAWPKNQVIARAKAWIEADIAKYKRLDQELEEQEAETPSNDRNLVMTAVTQTAGRLKKPLPSAGGFAPTLTGLFLIGRASSATTSKTGQLNLTYGWER